MKKPCKRVIWQRINNSGWSEEEAKTRPVGREYLGDYAIYKGEKMLAVGTRKECADQLGITETAVVSYASPSKLRNIAKHKNPENATFAIRLDKFKGVGGEND